ncbi:hypothetical protein [Bradyrhizobium symbiodeficiens]|uniref:Uncharacterized protein n=1 Tax=Bradyrhizobium symbiodeficiens TaxID=1404367 RepID=A0A6G9A0S9_9BRAD|nr:hypothetical protein [Bradyrhizobium symbiodeficiens]QIP05823.1 hypothetical protein HAV00_06015 [Bradyrhizobium symbiodeficiens]
MRVTRLMESHRDPRKFRLGFGFMKSAGCWRIVKPVAGDGIADAAMRIRAPKSPENASELWITR